MPARCASALHRSLGTSQPALSAPAAGDHGNAIWVHQPARLFRETLDELHALEGVTYSTLSHGEGWYFLNWAAISSGRSLLGRLLDLHFGAAQGGARAQIFRLAGAAEILHRLRALYQALHRLDPPAEDRRVPAVRPEFPHSIRFSVDRMTEALARVAPGAPPARRAACERLAGRLKASVDFGQIDELMPAASPPSSPTSRSNASRSTRRCVYTLVLSSPIDARRRCS